MATSKPPPASSPEHGEFWLPSEFLCDEKFPMEFPYEVESAVSSPPDESDSDEDDFFAALSQRIPKAEWAVGGGSPQSTLRSHQSAEHHTWDLIYAAAGQVARLKMASHSAGRGLLANPNTFHHQFGAVKPCPMPAQQMGRQYYQRVRAGCGGGYENVTRPLNLPHSAWPPLTRPALVNSGSGVKRECAGTGVFLPRRYSNPPEPRKKPVSGCPNVVLPAKVVQALNLSFEDMNVVGHSHPRFACGFVPDHEALMARRNALLEQQRRSLRSEGALNHEIRLPQEWTY